MIRKKWKIAPSVPGSFRKKISEHSPVVAQLLYNRKIHSESQLEEFLSPDYDKDLHDPFLLTDMDKGVQRIMQALDNKEKILIHGDYDADGVTSAVLLYEVFRSINVVSRC